MPPRRETILKFLLVVLFYLAAGPEIVAALELQILLEMLGATLFMTAFLAGAKLALMDLREHIVTRVLPAAPVAFIALAYVEGWLATAAALVASIQAAWTLAA